MLKGGVTLEVAIVGEEGIECALRTSAQSLQQVNQAKLKRKGRCMCKHLGDFAKEKAALSLVVSVEEVTPRSLP